MKFNPNLVFEIMKALENGDRLPRNREVEYHLLLLSDKGYIKLSESHMGYVRDKDIDNYPDICRLTWDGHMFLETISQSDNFQGWVWSLHRRVY